MEPEIKTKKYPIITPEFTIEGITFKYYIENWTSTAILIITKSVNPNVSNIHMNPWNIVQKLNIGKEVLEMAPKQNKFPDVDGKPIVKMEFLKIDTFFEFFKNNIESDCWLMYSTNEDNELQKTYFNLFIENIDEKIEWNKRKLLYDNFDNCKQEITKCMENGYTLYIIMNKFGVDFIYKKVPNNNLICMTEINYVLDDYKIVVQEKN